MKKVLGRGLSALIPDSFVKPPVKTETPAEGPVNLLAQTEMVKQQEVPQTTGFRLIPVQQIQTNEQTSVLRQKERGETRIKTVYSNIIQQ